MIRRALLSAASLAALALVASACSGDDDDDGGGEHLVTGGLYELTLSSVIGDTCWPDDNLVPPLAVGAIDVLVNASGADFTLSPSAFARFYFPPVAGTRDGNDLSAMLGNGTLVVTSNCSVMVTTSGDGLVTDENVFEVAFTSHLEASGTASNGCAVWAGQTWPGTTIPFPVLTDATDGTCSVSFAGTAVLPE